MKETIAVFKSRREAIRFGRALASMRVSARAISTPSRIGSSCGLSVLFPEWARESASRVLSYGDYFTFQGFYTL